VWLGTPRIFLSFLRIVYFVRPGYVRLGLLIVFVCVCVCVWGGGLVIKKLLNTAFSET
jgi:hypothetical protein